MASIEARTTRDELESSFTQLRSFIEEVAGNLKTSQEDVASKFSNNIQLYDAKIEELEKRLSFDELQALREVATTCVLREELREYLLKKDACTEDMVQELLASELDKRLPPSELRELREVATTCVMREELEPYLLKKDSCTVSVVQDLLSTKIPLPPEVTPDSLIPYLLKEDALHEEDIRSLLNSAVSRADYAKEQDRISSLYVSKEGADSRYLTRGEFDALKAIIVTKNDLQTMGKNELDELRSEQEMLKRSVPTRDHLNLIRAECDALRDTCNMLEARISKVCTAPVAEVVAPVVEVVAPVAEVVAPVVEVVAPVAEVVAPVVEVAENRVITCTSASDVVELRAQLAELRTQIDRLSAKCTAIPETRSFDFGTAAFKYMKIGDLRFLISNGFALPDAEVTFHLSDIELPMESIPASTGAGYTSKLDSGGLLTFSRDSDKTDVVVRRFMFWY
jgi:hypothetical protein